MEAIEKNILLNRESSIEKAISIQSRAISLLWNLENSFLTQEEKSIKLENNYNQELEKIKMQMSPTSSIESENHLSLHSNHLEIDTAIEITDFVRSKALKQEKVNNISHSSSKVTLSLMAASLLQ